MEKPGDDSRDDPMTVTVELLAEDWAAIEHALALHGHGGPARLVWLLERGLDLYGADEASWTALEGEESADAEERRRDLRRREAQALVVSLRARTLTTEKVMHELGDVVKQMSVELYANRRSMHRLRAEAAALEARLQPPAAPAEPTGFGGHRSPSLRRLLRRFFTRGRGAP